MASIDDKTLFGILALFAGIYGWLIKHLSNSNRHPNADKIVFHDVCLERNKRLEDCIENEIKQSKERYDNLIKAIDELKAMIKNGYGHR